MHRRTLQLLLIPTGSLACLVLAGCGGTADAADSPPATVTVTATQTAVRTVTTTATPPAVTVTSTVTADPVTSTITVTTESAAADAGAAAAADAPVPEADPAPAPQPLVASPPASTYYANCSAAKAAGAAPLYRGEPGYRSALDRDNDGVACEN